MTELLYSLMLTTRRGPRWFDVSLFCGLYIPHCSSLLSLHIAAFDGFALVVAFLTLTEGDDELDIAATGEELRGDDGVAILLASSELLDLPPLRQEFARTGADCPGVWLALLVVPQREAGVIEPQLAIANRHICPLELHVTFAGGAHF